MNYRIDAKKLCYININDSIYNRVKILFNVLDKIILGKSINDIHIVSGNKLKLLYQQYFETELRNAFNDEELFDKYQILYYVLLKHKFFCVSDSVESNNTVTIFISKSLAKYINNDKDKFIEIMTTMPLSGVYNELLNELWDIYNENLIHYIVTHDMFPYIVRPVFDNRKICTYCRRYTNITFIKCYRCRITHYCSNFCLYKDRDDHKRLCIGLL